MTRRPATWKIVTFGAALTGLGVAGAGIAVADDDRPGSLPAAVNVTVPAADGSARSAQDSPGAADAAPADAAPVDASPESADSPTESAWDSPADASPDVATPDVDSPDTANADSPT